MLGDKFSLWKNSDQSQELKAIGQSTEEECAADPVQPCGHGMASKFTQKPVLRDPANQLLCRVLLAPLAPSHLCLKAYC